MGLKDSIKKGIDKANNFINDKQQRYRLKEALEKEQHRLSSLYLELGKAVYHGTGRDIGLLKQEINASLATIETYNLELSKLKD